MHVVDQTLLSSWIVVLMVPSLDLVPKERFHGKTFSFEHEQKAFHMLQAVKCLSLPEGTNIREIT